MFVKSCKASCYKSKCLVRAALVVRVCIQYSSPFPYSLPFSYTWFSVWVCSYNFVECVFIVTAAAFSNVCTLLLDMCSIYIRMYIKMEAWSLSRNIYLFIWILDCFSLIYLHDNSYIITLFQNTNTSLFVNCVILYLFRAVKPPKENLSLEIGSFVHNIIILIKSQFWYVLQSLLA